MFGIAGRMTISLRKLVKGAVKEPATPCKCSHISTLTAHNCQCKTAPLADGQFPESFFTRLITTSKVDDRLTTLITTLQPHQRAKSKITQKTINERLSSLEIV